MLPRFLDEESVTVTVLVEWSRADHSSVSSQLTGVWTLGDNRSPGRAWWYLWTRTDKDELASLRRSDVEATGVLDTDGNLK